MELLFVLSSLVLVLATIAFSRARQLSRFKNLPPGSMGWPVIGETLDYLATRPIGVQHPFIAKRVKRYGSVFKTSLFGCPTVINTDAELNRFILMNEGRFFQSKYPSTVEKILGKFSMIQADGELHKRMRGLTVSFMQGHKLNQDFLNDIETDVLKRLSSWEGRTVLVQEEAHGLSFEFIAKQILSMDHDDKETQELKADFLSLVHGMIDPVRLPGMPYWTAMKRREKIVRLIGRKLQERKQKDVNYNDFLQNIVDDEHGRNFTLEQISDFIIFMLFAAHDTTSTAMTMTIKNLLAHPDVFKELKEEHMEIRKHKGSERLEGKDYLEMSFTQCVINETLRLTNVLTSAHRVALQDVEVKGYVIPKGWKVLSNWTSIHLDPSLYPEPLKFNPWRWKTMGSTKYFTPFSGGPRLCTGAELARLEISLFLHFAITMYSWEPAEQDEAICFGTVKMKKGLPITVKRLASL